MACRQRRPQGTVYCRQGTALFQEETERAVLSSPPAFLAEGRDYAEWKSGGGGWGASHGQ